MTEIKLNIQLKMPSPVKKDEADSLLKKVCDYIHICELEDQDSTYHWSYLRAVYKKLSEKNNVSGESLKILTKLSEFFDKYNHLSSDGQHVDMDGTDFFKYSPITGK